jgi:hypothetical protein
MAQIECVTLFDITETGVTGHPRPERWPFVDLSGSVISDSRSWNVARDQQRNLETLIQLISMRTQIDIVSSPKKIKNRWTFVFEVERAEVYGVDLSVLQNDSHGVPMTAGAQSKTIKNLYLEPGKNVWFRILEKHHGQEE